MNDFKMKTLINVLVTKKFFFSVLAAPNFRGKKASSTISAKVKW